MKQNCPYIDIGKAPSASLTRSVLREVPLRGIPLRLRTARAVTDSRYRSTPGTVTPSTPARPSHNYRFPFEAFFFLSARYVILLRRLFGSYCNTC